MAIWDADPAGFELPEVAGLRASSQPGGPETVALVRGLLAERVPEELADAGEVLRLVGHLDGLLGDTGAERGA